MNSLKVGALCALLALGTVVPYAALAQNPPASAPAKMHKPLKGSVYVCNDCKMYFTPAEAKKMKGKDPMGHKLVKIKASKLPEGYTGAKPMGKMHDGKM